MLNLMSNLLANDGQNSKKDDQGREKPHG